MYIGAGLNWSKDIINDKAINDLCPPDSSVNDCFHICPSLTLTSKPCVNSLPSGGCNLAKLPGSNSANISPKSLKI